MKRGSQNFSYSPHWKRIRRGYYELDGWLYISRTRYGWEYGTLDADGPVAIDEVSRPIGRVKELAEEGRPLV